MTLHARPLGLIDHGVGALLSLGVLSFTVEIATATSSAMSSLVSLLDDEVRFGFLLMDGHGSWWGMLCGLALLGGLVVGGHSLVRKALVRAWVPPIAVFGLASSGFTMLLTAPETGWREATMMGTGLGAVIGAAFTAWWCGSIGAARARGRRAIPGMGRAG